MADRDRNITAGPRAWADSWCRAEDCDFGRGISITPLRRAVELEARSSGLKLGPRKPATPTHRGPGCCAGVPVCTMAPVRASRIVTRPVLPARSLADPSGAAAPSDGIDSSPSGAASSPAGCAALAGRAWAFRCACRRRRASFSAAASARNALRRRGVTSASIASTRGAGNTTCIRLYPGLTCLLILGPFSLGPGWANARPEGPRPSRPFRCPFVRGPGRRRGVCQSYCVGTRRLRGVKCGARRAVRSGVTIRCPEWAP